MVDVGTMVMIAKNPMNSDHGFGMVGGYCHHAMELCPLGSFDRTSANRVPPWQVSLTVWAAAPGRRRAREIGARERWSSSPRGYKA